MKIYGIFEIAPNYPHDSYPTLVELWLTEPKAIDAKEQFERTHKNLVRLGLKRYLVYEVRELEVKI